MTIGKENSIVAESTRQDIVLKAPQHNTYILLNPFFQAVWLPKERRVWPQSEKDREAPPVYFSRVLNNSQHAAVRRILSGKSDDRIIVIQGPPGTGKTTVIAASVISHHHVKSGQNIWVAAQWNVAVKNIAEEFIKEGFHEFKVLVSKDFHYDWWAMIPRANALSETSWARTSLRRAGTMQLLDCKVILLSMFSNPNIDVFLCIVPVETIILDEASPIECGNYLPVFHRFHSTLSKLVFIGDDKQLPPYGQEDIPELRSVFELWHLRKRALFLETQCPSHLNFTALALMTLSDRMPHVMGDFISRNVYGGKLLTHHSSSTSKAFGLQDNGSLIHRSFSNARHKNHEEAHVVVKLALLYESRGMSFRIITPYYAQRSHIENRLKQEELPWEGKVVNVDSFQGNEDDHIIVSVVRSEGSGFLKNQRRTNVMLTRCKQSMVIYSSRAFLFGKAVQDARWQAGCLSQ
ncbi:P-loop containing nucleoside triphosphate hydrolase protein [Boletus coccyginus]|nr:P-loop containing nucleoside triphosphate hydrolase protein [Boletus coccyginus]